MELIRKSPPTPRWSLPRYQMADRSKHYGKRTCVAQSFWGEGGDEGAGECNLLTEGSAIYIDIYIMYLSALHIHT